MQRWGWPLQTIRCLNFNTHGFTEGRGRGFLEFLNSVSYRHFYRSNSKLPPPPFPIPPMSRTQWMVGDYATDPFTDKQANHCTGLTWHVFSLGYFQFHVTQYSYKMYIFSNTYFTLNKLFKINLLFEQSFERC